MNTKVKNISSPQTRIALVEQIIENNKLMLSIIPTLSDEDQREMLPKIEESINNAERLLKAQHQQSQVHPIFQNIIGNAFSHLAK